MLREFTCIMCPNGCELEVKIDENHKIVDISGALCTSGKAYVKQEIIDPRRNIATSVKVENGILPLASVRLTNPIPKDRIWDAMKEMKKCVLQAPVEMNTVLISNLLGLDTDVIVTKPIASKK